ncbi:uncharacterized protein LOC122094124 [Macadamia integrifolia]|uniref:uncharacterized protein LOC122094124 n=1 Tax=Macadamia integrifolia TaxID=60698 RepID=UPI001C52CCDA|nr:uncharacterized protein LOC122094124 [Macadamia integrifolia]
MEVSAIADAVAVTTTHCIGFSNSILGPHCCNSLSHLSILCGSSSEHATGILSITAGISAVIAPPAIRSNTYRTAPRTFTRQRRRTRRRSSTGDSDDGAEDGFFGDGDDGPFGGGHSGGSGGRRWNFDGYGGFDWEESSYSSFSIPALDFIYEVICWIALSNCMHFAFKKLARIVADGIGDPSRDKVPMRLVSMC